MLKQNKKIIITLTCLLAAIASLEYNLSSHKHGVDGFIVDLINDFKVSFWLTSNW